MVYKTTRLQSIFNQFKLSLFFFLFLLSISVVHSKSIDDELWTGMELKKKITSKIKLELGQQIRLKDHWSLVHKTLTDLSLSYKILPFVEFSGGYRYNVYEDKEKSRINFDIKIDFNIKYSPSLRFSLEQASEINEEPEDIVVRNKLSFEYPLSKQITPYISYEIFHTIEDESFSYNQFRLGVGIKYEFNKDQSIKLFYIYEENLEKNEIENTNIWGLKYGYSF